MYEHTVLHKLSSFVVGVLIVVFLLLLGARGITSATSGGTDGVSGNPNVVTGSLAVAFSGVGNTINTVGYKAGQGTRLAGHTISNGSRLAILATIHGVRFVGESDMRSLRFCGNLLWQSSTYAGRGVWVSATFVGRGMVGSAMFTANTTSSTMAFITSTVTTIPLTKPADTTPMPIIKPLSVTALTMQIINTKASSTPAIANPTPAVVAPLPLPIHVTPAAALSSESQAESNDLYAWGNCTWWVFTKRSEIGDPIPNTWGNATSWSDRAAADGYLVDHQPSPGAIMQISGVDYGLGHVAFVESVDPDGTWHISEMNVQGLDVVDHQAEPPSAAAHYEFIHG